MISEVLSSIKDVAIYPIVTLLIFFTAGALAGLSVALGTFLRQRREIARLKKAIDAGPGLP